jgi:anti-anti-sigma regulatory factor
MEFKIDTKPTYVQITPVYNHIDANLTAALRQKCNELTESGSQNIIIDLHNCLGADDISLNELPELHENFYASNRSLVFTNLSASLASIFKERELETMLNIAPTLAEAVDIISMEILERDLFGEE